MKYRLPFGVYHRESCRTVLEGCPSAVVWLSKFDDQHAPTRVTIQFLDPMDESVFVCDFYEAYKRQELEIRKQTVNAKTRQLSARWTIHDNDVLEDVYNQAAIEMAADIDREALQSLILDVGDYYSTQLYCRFTQVPEGRVAQVIERSNLYLHATRHDRYVGFREFG